MNLAINKAEMFIFAIYTVYSLFTATLHVMQIWTVVNHEYDENPKIEMPRAARLAYEILEARPL